MEKIEFRGVWVRGDFYNAADVDALLAGVRRLVEAVNNLISVYDADTPVPLVIDSWMDDIRKAIAAVERHLLKE